MDGGGAPPARQGPAGGRPRRAGPWSSNPDALPLTTRRSPPLALPQEDETIVRLVGELGTKSWAKIAGNLSGRVGKQCRERCAAS